MAYKIFIIDDNHSLIDSIKVMLKDFEFPLQYDSAFRFQEANSKMSETGCYYNRQEQQKLQELVNKVTELSNSENKNNENGEENLKETVDLQESIQIADLIDKNIESPFNEEGIFLLIVEHDTENNTKGLDFIQGLIKSSKGMWKESDFILMTSRSDFFEKKIDLGVDILAKPIDHNQLKYMITQRIKKLKETQKQIQEQLSTLSLDGFPILSSREEEKPKRRRKMIQKTE